MARRNIDKTRKAIENRPETDMVQIDGDSSEIIFRAIVDDLTDDFEEAVEDLPEVGIEKVKYVGFGTEVTLK